jgi:hypothetical protein
MENHRKRYNEEFRMSIIDSYKKLKNKNFFNLKEKVNTSIPELTDVDYKRGWVRRYFAQKTNDKVSPIYEVNSSEFVKLTSRDIFTLVTIKWRIAGPKDAQYDSKGNVMDKGVRESNRIAISLEADKIPNLKMYLPNLLQFHK